MKSRLQFKKRRGSVLIVAMLVTAMLALVLGSYFNLSLTSSRQTRRTFDRNTAFHLTEAGIEEAVWSYNQALAGSSNAWTDWNTDGVAAWRKFTDFTLTPGSSGSVKVYASDITPSTSAPPVIVAEAAVQTGSTTPVTQMIEVTLRRRSFFANGITAIRTLLFRGNRTSFDSWNSDPDEDPSTPPVDYTTDNRNDRGGIGSAAVANTSVLLNHATIYGFVSTAGAIPQIGGDGLIGPFGTTSGVIDPTHVSTDFTATFPIVAAPLDGELAYPLGTTLGVAGQTTRWRTPFVKLTGKETLTILGHVTLIITAQPGTAAIDITGSSSIVISEGSSLTVYFEGDVKIAGNGLGNDNIQPVACILWGGNTTEDGQAIDITGRGALRAVIYAPNGDVTVSGNGAVMGSIVARDITFAGNAAFHYDASLAKLVDHAPFGPHSWRLVTSAAERQTLTPHFSGW
jgi:Tfp pilus assembly protein PilX